MTRRREQIARSTSSSSRCAVRFTLRFEGFTLIEILVVLGVIAVLLAILIPAAISVRERSRSAVCLSNLRQIGQAVVMYANDNHDRVIPADLRAPAFVHQPGNWATILVYG